ncbi:MAG: SurA N-terminal domain-containing protein [Proteobacteria bacterium]|nr:SurA N-terminal domain-containing protein [Pseudomonadota bacterium]
MIQNLRQYSDNWFFKGLLGLIVLCFVFFGVGDLIRNIIYDRPIAKVGKHTVSMEELDRALKIEVQRIQSIKKAPVSMEELNKLGFVEKILDRIVAQHLLEQEINNLKIVVSDSVVRQNIKGLQPFLKDGQFDAALYKSVLQNIGISEQNLVKDIRRQILDQQYFLSFSDAATISPYYRDILIDGMIKKRSFASVTVNLNAITLTQKITPEDVEDFYNSHKDYYKKPESRDLTVLKLDLEKLSQKIDVQDEELKKIYEDRKSTYSDPEKRTIKKVTLKTEDEAKNILDLLKDQKNIKDVIKKQKDLNVEAFENITKKDWKEDNAEKIFNLGLNENSGIIRQQNEFSIYVVEGINPEKQKSFDVVKAEILKEIKIERFQETYKTIKHKIEDDLAGGSKIEDVAKEHSLDFHFVKGLTKDGDALTHVKALKDMEKHIIDQAFELSEGNASNVIDTSYDKSVVVFVSKIHAEHVPELKDIKDKVEKDATSEKKHKKGAELVQKIAQEAKSAADLSKFAAQNHFSFVTDRSYSRLSIAEDKELLATKVVGVFDKAFSLPLNRAIASATVDGFIVVMPVKEMNDKSIDQTKKQEIIKRLNGLMHDAIAWLMVETLKSKYSVDIKSKNLEAFLKIILKNE